MASPFKFFRKYSSGIMIVMVILSMLLFTMDGLFSDPGQNLWLLGLLLGGAVFAVAGIGQGKWLQWGIGGAVLGALLGFILPSFVETGGLKTSLGVISDEEIADLQMRRAIANRFMQEATVSTYGAEMARFARLFGFQHNNPREDVVFGKMMRAEADRLGIEVDPVMVKEYLAQNTGKLLTKSAYLEIRNGLTYQGQTLNEKFTNEIIGDEIKAQLAWQMTRPRMATLPPGPEVYWQYFRRMNVRQQLNLTALDVDDFVDQIETPSDSEITQLFAQYKTKFPHQDGAGKPGFRLPPRVKVAYAELSSDASNGGIAEVTEDDIKAYYEENKESPLIRQPVLPDLEPTENEANDGSEGESDDKEKADETQPEKSDSEKTDTKAKDKAETKADPAAKESAETKETEEVEKEPAATKEAETEKTATEETATEETATEETATEEAADDDGSCGPFIDETTAAGETTADDENITEPETEVKTQTTEPTAPPAKEDNSPPAIPDSPKLEDVKPTAPSEPEYEYRTLDDELKQKITTAIEAQRLEEFVQEKMDAAIAEMDALARDRSKERFSLIEQNATAYEVSGDDLQLAYQRLSGKMEPKEQELNKQFKAYAEKNGLSYAETPLVTFNEFLEEENYPVATASEPSINPMMAAQAASVAQTIFQGFNNDEQNNDAQMYMPRRAQRIAMSLEGGQTNYVYWAIDFSPSHIPELDEDGVRDAVILAWKRMKARDLVQKRGDDLAKIVQAGLGKEGDDKLDMTASLKDETSNGKPDGSALAVRSTEPFSWLTSSMSQRTFQQQASMSSIEYSDPSGGVVRKVGGEFMKEVFENMKNEQVAVVPNIDLSKYYVVHVTDRFPPSYAEEGGLRERFATEGEQFGFQQSAILGLMRQELVGPPNVEWEKNVWRRYDVDPDSEPDE